MEVKILSAKFDIKDAHKIEVAKQHGAYSQIGKAVFHGTGGRHRRGEKQWSARTWRGRFPGRSEMVISAQGAQ